MAAEQVTGMYRSIALVDISYLFKRNYMGMGRDAAPGDAAQKTLDELAGVRESVDHVIICADAPPYRRKDIFPEYKAQRERPPEEELAQKRWLLDRIEKDGYSVARAKGYEADDVIATLCADLSWCGDVRIVGSDKDVAQCVGNGVRMFVPPVGDRPGEIRDSTAIKAKYGVDPSDMPLWLALCGDKSDNIPGVPGIGPKKAAQLIADCKSLNGIAEALATASGEGEELSAMWMALAAHWEKLVMSLKLTQLELDAPVNVDELLKKREPVRLVKEEEVEEPTEAEFIPMSPPPPAGTPMPEMKAPERAKSEPPPAPKTAALAKVSHGEVTADLQPCDLASAKSIATWVHNGRLYPQFVSPEAIFTIILRGKELGLGVTTSLAGFHIVEGRPTASADLIRSLAERDPDCEYFYCVENTATSATWETKHKKHPKPTRYTYTLKEAEDAGLTRPTRSGKPSPWQSRPRDMVTKTAGAKLARLVYPRAVLGLYDADEMGDAA
jgi:5'-3' exonuclease